MANNEPEYNLLAELRPDVDATAEAGLEIAGIPDHMHEGLLRYLRQGMVPGSFLAAILCNDYFGACAQADRENMRALHAYAVFLNNMPSACYGSRVKVDAWAKAGADRRKVLYQGS